MLGLAAAGATFGLRQTAWADSPAGFAAGMQAVVLSDTLNVRGGPSTDDPVVAVLANGATVTLLGSSADGQWWRVSADADVGYVDGAYLQPTGQSASNQPFDVHLAVPYAPQLTPVWCDPADIEMWRGYHTGDPAGGTYALQQAVWSWEEAHNDGFTVDQWDCSPFAVASAAHQWIPSLGFDHFRYDDALAGTRLLAWLLAHPAYHEPSVALIWRGDHYVLVRGVRADSDPSQNPAAQIFGFYIADPNRGQTTWLGQDYFVPLDRWLNELFTPVSYLTPHTGQPGDVWQNKLVAIQRSWTQAGPTPDGQLNASSSQYA